jgi:hypothetical protein
MYLPGCLLRMKTQDYVLKKFVRATSAAEALAKDTDTPVTEVFLTQDKPVEGSVHAVGFRIHPDDSIPYEMRRR